jgi:hypothetical protein
MAQKIHPVAYGRDPVRPADTGRFLILEEPLSKGRDIDSLRVSAAFSGDAIERQRSLGSLYDMDSLAFVAEASPHEDSRKAAGDGLALRISSMPPAVIRHLAEEAASPSIRSCALGLLPRRPG